MLHTKIHRINPGCPRPSIALQWPKSPFVLFYSYILPFVVVIVLLLVEYETDYFYSVTTTDVACDFSGSDWLCGWTDISEGHSHWLPSPAGYTRASEGEFSVHAVINQVTISLCQVKTRVCKMMLVSDVNKVKIT